MPYPDVGLEDRCVYRFHHKRGIFFAANRKHAGFYNRTTRSSEFLV